MSAVKKLFKSAFNHLPQAVGTAPGRVNLIGEHIDYNGGMVMPAALQRQVSVAIAPTHSDEIHIRSSRFDHSATRRLGQPKQNDWTDYAVGAVNKAQTMGWLDTGLSLAIESDLPDGAGVSSSAALITAIFRAVQNLNAIDSDPVEVALAARAVENDYIGMPCGIMDQFAVGLAEYGYAIALNTDDLSFETLAIPETWRFITVHTGIRRELSDGRYKARFEECEAAKQALKTADLCTLSAAQSQQAAALPPPLAQRVRHTQSEHQRTCAAITALKTQNIGAFAALMTASHRSYSHDFEASLPEIDAMIEGAVNRGAHAARLTGGGFGGCIVALVDAGDAAAWSQAFIADNPKAWVV